MCQTSHLQEQLHLGSLTPLMGIDKLLYKVDSTFIVDALDGHRTYSL
jgi:hypothetical protein